MAGINLGNISEGIFGAAFIAKLSSRQGTQIKYITSSDVLAVLEKLKKARTTKTGFRNIVELKYDIGQSAQDKITLNLKLGEVMMGHLFDRKNWNNFTTFINSACTYMNSKPMSQEALGFYENNINNEITIVVDGVTSNSSVKEDVVLKSDGITLNKVSLKSGYRSQIGQIGGDAFSVFERLFFSGKNPKTGESEPGLGLQTDLKSLEKQFDKQRGAEKSKSNFQQATHFIYKKSVDIFNQTPISKLVPSIEKFLLYHSTKFDQQIQLVELGSVQAGSFKVLNPNLLGKNLRKLKTLRALYKQLEWPTILIYSTGTLPASPASDNVLFGIRVKYDSKDETIYNIIERGTLLKTLITDPNYNV